MKKLKTIICFALAFLLAVLAMACSPVDNNYGVSSQPAETSKTTTTKVVEETESDLPIMSSDRVMSNYFDISLFDEENYSEIYLGKKFKFDAVFAGDKFEVPLKIADLAESGWYLCEGNTYDENSLVFSYETVDAIFENTDGVRISAQLYNSTRSSLKLSECYVVKFIITNDFYTSPNGYNAFKINGITNTMAITDVINTLGTPSHFYAVSESCYYLDYFVSKKDRRNGITVYVNPIDDSILSIEFSYYK